MAFFKFRKGGDDHAAAPSAPAPESIEVMRRRARHRLIGAAVLVLMGVIGFPLLFDSQPRPIAVDISIEIPDKNKAKPLRAPAPASSASNVAAGAAAKSAASAEVVVAPSVVSAAPVAPARAPAVASDGMVTEYADKPAAKPSPKPEAKLAEKAADKPTEKAADKAQEAAKAHAAAAAKDAEKKPAAEGRFVVQVGSFADGAKAHEARIKLERAGLKTYAQVVESKDGRRTRVRVGPYPTKAEAEKVGEKIKKLDLPVGILEL